MYLIENFEMRKLSEILKELPFDYELYGNKSVQVRDVFLDSRKLHSSDAFVALKGSAFDGHRFIEAAIEKGASVIFCEDLPTKIREHVAYVHLSDLKEKLTLLAKAFYGSAGELKLVGVTGTNGKTTVSTLFYNTMMEMGVQCGLISTVKIMVGAKEYPSELTTPDVLTTYRFMKMMRDSGCQTCVMEVSSHAIDQGRIDGLSYDVAAFTNLSHDHLDYHGSFKEYAYTKKRLFDGLSPKSVAVYNVDDKNGEVMVQNCKAEKQSYGLRMQADYKAKVMEHDFNGMHLRIGEYEFFTGLVGKFNAYNVLAVLAIAEAVGFERIEILRVLSAVSSADGRFDLVRNVKKGITAIVDYAHTPDALDNVLQTISHINKKKGKIITLIGCGGDRDKTKRPLMAKVAINYSDAVILTSDNPRSENPEDILDDMEKGIEKAEEHKVLRISDRKSAIKTAISLANSTDVILVAGKGHETYQEIKGVRYPFDDKQILQEFLLHNI